MTSVFLAALAAAALAGPVSAATVNLSQNQELRLELHDVSSTSFTFLLPDGAPWYSNYGGYLKWSTKADGRKDSEGDWGTCFECGYDAGSWALASDGLFSKVVNVDFGKQLDTVFVWIRSTYGKGGVSYSDPQPTSPAPVPLPAAGLLLMAALGGLGVARAAKARR